MNFRVREITETKKANVEQMLALAIKSKPFFSDF